MEDKSSIIFGNPIDQATINKGIKTKESYIKKFGDDSKKEYHLAAKPIPTLDFMGVNNLVFSDKPMEFPKNAMIVGNIRMGFGHYRISMAIASCAKSMGYQPYWLDLASFDATGSKMIRAQNDLYSLASRISQKSHLFNHFIWEPLNCEGFKKLTYNSTDQKSSELLAPIFHDIPKDIPYVATHAWPSQGAVHAGLTHVVNAIPDNWPMALHLSEGAIHCVQTPYAYNGYKGLIGFAENPLKGMGDADLKEVGAYIDHELVSNLEHDTEKRVVRLKDGSPIRILISVGGAGAGQDQFLAMIKHLLPYVKENKVALFLNFGDHLNVFDFISKEIPGFDGQVKKYFDTYDQLVSDVEKMDEEKVSGIYCVYNKDIFQAVYSTNLLMRKSDLLITKPSELAYYPVPKLFMRHIGGHEVYGAIHGREYGDAFLECPEAKSLNEMIDRIINDKDLLLHMNETILKLKAYGKYNGGYKAVELAVKGR